MKINLELKSLKNSRLVERVGTWVVERPDWLKFSTSVFLISLVSVTLVVFLYDRFWGNSPLSNRQRLVKEALGVCDESQNLSYAQVDFEEWPLDKTFGLEGYTVGNVVSFLSDSASYGEDGPSDSEAAQAYVWLQAKYSDYFTAQSRCDILAEEYQQKYAY